ncbi:MAG: ribbon-helix-helix domain-containing protein [Pseudomonadota bacterium]
MSEAIRWTIKVSKETDLSLRTALGAQGMKKGDLSKFVEDAVRWRLFDRRVESLRDSFRGVPAAELQAAIDQAVREVRKEARRRKK